MPLNVKKNYTYIPSVTGSVKLVTRTGARGRLWNETYYRSIEYGLHANLIEVGIIEDMTTPPGEGILVTHNKTLKLNEMLSASGMSVPIMSLYSLSINWNEEIRITVESGLMVAKLYGIRWQIGGGETLLATLGTVTKDRVFTTPQTSFKLSAGPADFTPGAVLYLRPRTRRYTLVSTSYTDPNTMITTIGWDIGALRATVNADTGAWIRLPVRGSDVQDQDGSQQPLPDAPLGVAFPMTALKGGDGLPATPAGLNTGPDRTLIHLNYAEQADGSMGVLNQVFEWVGESSSLGNWQRYA